MKDRLNDWLISIYKQWWKVIAIYFSACLTIYLFIGQLIDPLSIPPTITWSVSNIERRLFLIVVTIFAASHLVLFLSIVALRQLQIRALHPGFENLGGTHTLKDIIPATNLLTYERILMKDRKLPPIVFASRVLLAINGNGINEKAAKDLLFGSGYRLEEITSRVYSLTKDETHSRRPNDEI